MLKRPLIVGVKGNMGRRYAAIMRSLGVDYVGMDAGEEIPGRYDSVLIATPTDTHADLVRYFALKDRPILVEKPIAKSAAEAERVVLAAVARGVPIRMVNQYAQFVEEGDEGPSYYHYFNHGKDGLAWDCISIIGLAKGEVEVGEESPLWRCAINGRTLRLSQMDMAYVAMIRDWVGGEVSGSAYAIEAHHKVEAYIRRAH